MTSIVNNVKIIFVNLPSVDGKGNIDHVGFEIAKNGQLWDWIIKNVDTYDIDIIIKATKTSDEQIYVWNDIYELHAKGVFMVDSIGNDGKNHKDDFYGKHPKAYFVGSIDHENRGGKVSKCTRIWRHTYCYDVTVNDLYSRKGWYSGAALQSNLQSSYGASTSSDQGALDFVMPGNGVPVVNYNEDAWVYSTGTSFSTPYLAAASLIAILHTTWGMHQPVTNTRIRQQTWCMRSSRVQPTRWRTVGTIGTAGAWCMWTSSTGRPTTEECQMGRMQMPAPVGRQIRRNGR